MLSLIADHSKLGKPSKLLKLLRQLELRLDHLSTVGTCETSKVLLAGGRVVFLSDLLSLPLAIE